MTISEIRQMLRIEASDDGPSYKKEDDYYNALIIVGLMDLEPMMGQLIIRDGSYQFQPMRDNDKTLLYEDDGITPKIDVSTFYYPDDPDAHSPADIFVSKGLRVATDKESGHIETADFIDDFGNRIEENDIAFIKIDADIAATDPDSVAFDISLDNRESWLGADYGFEILINENGTTGFVDVSRLPSSYVSLKWTLTGPSAIVRNTTFWRYYIPKDRLRHYASDVIELAKLRLIEIKIDQAIKNQNDPMVIKGFQDQAMAIRLKYGLDKNAGDTRPIAGGIGINPFPMTREKAAVFGLLDNSYDPFFRNGQRVSIQNDGTIRRVAE